MNIESPSSITPREASIRLEWISTRILPGVAVLLLSIPLCQWADSILPDGIVPVYVTYMMSVTVLWSMYMAMQYAFVGIAHTRKAKNSVNQSSAISNNQSVHNHVFLLEAEPIVGLNEAESISDAEVIEVIEEIEEIAEDEAEPVIMEEQSTILKQHTSSNDSASNVVCSTYQQGIDDFYQSQAECQKKRLDTIHEYLLYIMSPFVYEEDMEEFCTDLLRFAMNHEYRSEVEWKRFKAKLSSFDIRHLIWNVAVRMGLGKGKLFSNDDCAYYIESRFPSLCVTAKGERLSHNTLKNLAVTSNSDQIHCDNPAKDGLLFHIPSQLGLQKD